MQYMKLQDWIPNERPREKLLQKGAHFLSDAELLAVLFGTGMRGLNCVEWARERLAVTGSLNGFFNLSLEKLMTMEGVGPARSAQIMAVKEMACRFARASISPRTQIKDPEMLSDYLRLSIGSQKRETFRVFFLNKKLEILEEKDLFVGTIDETPVYPREIVRQALLCHATGIILAHNHPSGRLQPSPEDIRVTEQVVAACALVGIRVMDHVIVGLDGCFSFSNEGILPRSSRN